MTSNDNNDSLVRGVYVLDVRRMTCTDETCDTPDDPVVAVLTFVGLEGEVVQNGCCAACLVRTMDRIEAGDLAPLAQANFTPDDIDKQRGGVH